MMNSQRSDTEKLNLIEEGIDEFIKHHEITSKTFKVLNIRQCHLIA